MNLPHIMVDLETLGTGDHAAIVQIAAVRFDPFGGEDGKGLVSSPEGSFNFHISLESKKLGVIDGPTVQWWMQQDEKARRRVFGGGGGAAASAIMRFDRWVEEQGPVETVWANSPNFDLRLLRQMYERVQGGPVNSYPFTHGQERDVRTLRKVLDPERKLEPPFVGVEHDALDDCFHQVAHVINILRELRG